MLPAAVTHLLAPSMQEEVCMVMRYVADEVTQYADDIQVRYSTTLLPQA